METSGTTGSPHGDDSHREDGEPIPATETSQTSAPNSDASNASDTDSPSDSNKKEHKLTIMLLSSAFGITLLVVPDEIAEELKGQETPDQETIRKLILNPKVMSFPLGGNPFGLGDLLGGGLHDFNYPFGLGRQSDTPILDALMGGRRRPFGRRRPGFMPVSFLIEQMLNDILGERRRPENLSDCGNPDCPMCS